jgi:SAM-dependent methyltransferase
MAERLKHFAVRLPGIRALQRQRDLRTLEPRSPEESVKARAQSRWRTSQPNVGLTWGKELSGDAFIRKVSSYEGFDPASAVLEVGPGYGRLAEAALRLEVPFRRWVGVDVAEVSVRKFNERFPEEPVEAVLGDIESISLDEEFGTAVSSLTLKHLYPDCERALRNVAAHLADGGRVFFDLIEGDRQFFERIDGVTFIRQYTRDEVPGLLERASLLLETLDEVDHDDDPEHRRLLVVARKAG